MSDRRWVCPGCEAFHAVIPDHCRVCGEVAVARRRRVDTFAPEPPAPITSAALPPQASLAEPGAWEPPSMLSVPGADLVSGVAELREAAAPDKEQGPAHDAVDEADEVDEVDEVDHADEADAFEVADEVDAFDVGDAGKVTARPARPAAVMASTPITNPTTPLGQLVGPPGASHPDATQVPPFEPSSETVPRDQWDRPVAEPPWAAGTTEPVRQRRAMPLLLSVGLLLAVGIGVWWFTSARGEGGTESVLEPRGGDGVSDPLGPASTFDTSVYFRTDVDLDTWTPGPVDEERSYGWRTVFERAPGTFIAIDVGKGPQVSSAKDSAEAIGARLGNRLTKEATEQDYGDHTGWYIEFTGQKGDRRIDVFVVVEGRGYAIVGATTDDLETIRRDIERLVASLETKT